MRTDHEGLRKPEAFSFGGTEMAIATQTTLLQGLRCRACGQLQPLADRYVCEPRLGAALGIARRYIKDDTRNPALSFKDRPVAVALARAVSAGLDTLACASTGNLASAVAAAAARNAPRAVLL